MTFEEKFWFKISSQSAFGRIRDRRVYIHQHLVTMICPKQYSYWQSLSNSTNRYAIVLMSKKQQPVVSQDVGFLRELWKMVSGYQKGGKIWIWCQMSRGQKPYLHGISYMIGCGNAVCSYIVPSWRIGMAAKPIVLFLPYTKNLIKRWTWDDGSKFRFSFPRIYIQTC